MREKKTPSMLLSVNLEENGLFLINLGLENEITSRVVFTSFA